MDGSSNQWKISEWFFVLFFDGGNFRMPKGIISVHCTEASGTCLYMERCPIHVWQRGESNKYPLCKVLSPVSTQ